MQSTPLLLTYTNPLWPQVLAPDRVLSISQIEIRANKYIILN